MSGNMRKCFGVAVTIIGYYVIHEGAHLLIALILGVFQEIRFKEMGVQIVVEASGMSNIQLAIFSIMGSVATLLVGYVLVLSKNWILLSDSKVLKAVFYYATLGFLVNDPIYLSVLCGFFGGGDMNGIVLFGIQEIAARLIYGVIAVVNIFIFIKYIYPAYKQNFVNHS